MTDETQLGSLDVSQPSVSNGLEQTEPIAGPSQAPQPTHDLPRVNKTYPAISYSNPRQPTEEDFEMGFCKWFYGSIKKLKTRPKPRRCTIPLTRHWFRRAPSHPPVNHSPRVPIDIPSKEVNQRLEPHMYQYLTQDISANDLRPIEEITTYKISARARGFTEKRKKNNNGSSLSESNNNNIDNNRTNSNQLDEISTEPQADSNDIAQSSPSNGYSDNASVTLILKSHRTIIDRRPLLKRQALCSGASDGLVQSSEVSSTSCLLIGPGEDCDESDGEFYEIDCDAA